MKIQLDTDNKTIKLESDVKMSKLIETLKKLFPNNEWKTFTLQTHTTISGWSSPIYIREYVQPYPSYPWYTVSGSNTLGTGGNSIQAASVTLKSGIYNVEV